MYCDHVHSQLQIKFYSNYLIAFCVPFAMDGFDQTIVEWDLVGLVGTQLSRCMFVKSVVGTFAVTL